MTDRLTPAQFDKAVKQFPRMSDDGKAAARSVLVDGNVQAEVAKYLDIPRQQVNRWVQSIKKAHSDGTTKEESGRIKLSDDLVAVKEKRSQAQGKLNVNKKSGRAAFPGK